MDAFGNGRAGRVRVLAVLAVLPAVLLAGCGGTGDDPSTPAATSPASASPTSASPTGLDPSPTDAGPTDEESPDGEPPDDGASPTPGTAIPGETMTADQAQELQAAVDGGAQPWRTDVAAVASAFVAGELGWTDADVALADPHTAEVTDPAGGRIVTLQLRQPAREGQGGIWVVVSGVWLT